jgi:hypothetical protein
MTPDAPLILTLALDERSFAFFDERRKRHFPPERNHLSAHLTLFHRLPHEHEPTILDMLARTAAVQPPIPLDVTGLRCLGRGVAYTLSSSVLSRLRHELAKSWALWLTLQDRQKHQPHVTVQNKVEPAEARELLSRLTADFKPFRATGTGLDLWRYRGGPWDKARSFPFVPG